MKWPEIERRLRESGFRAFTGREFEEICGLTRTAAKFQLIRLTQRRLLTRLRRGLYAVSNRVPSSWSVANRLYKPSYVSLESALAYYGLIPESVYSVTSVTTRPTRRFEATGRLFAYRTIKRGAFTGYRSVTIDGELVLVAEREKAVADYLWFVFLKKIELDDRLALDRAQRRLVERALARFDHPTLAAWFTHDLKIPDRRASR